MWVNGATTDLLTLDNIFYAVSSPGTSVQMIALTEPQSTTTANVQFVRNDYWAVGASMGDTLVTFNSTAYTDLATWEQDTGQEMLDGSSEALSVDPSLKDPGSGGTLGDGTPIDAGILGGLVAYRIQPTSVLIGLGVDPATFDIDSGGSDFYTHLLPPPTGYALGADQR